MTIEANPLALDPISLKGLLDRVHALQASVDQLRHQATYAPEEDAPSTSAKPSGVERFIAATSDGWLKVMMSGREIALPAGLKVSLESTSGGRDSGIVTEGLSNGRTFDIVTGYLVAPVPRFTDLVVAVSSAPPVTIGGVTYDLKVQLSYRAGGVARSAGPFPAMTLPTNPVPRGDHELEIADFPHLLGHGYSAHSTVWFRIGRRGDRYLHAGAETLGCITCAPSGWEAIYDVVHRSRKPDGRSVGTLRVT